MSGYVREMRRTKTDGRGRQEGGRGRERRERKAREPKCFRTVEA